MDGKKRLYHVVLRQIHEVRIAVEATGTDDAIKQYRKGKGEKVSDVTYDLDFHDVDGPVPEGFSPRFDDKDVVHMVDDDGEEDEYAYHFSADMIYWCRPIFNHCVRPGTNMMDHYQVEKILKEEGVILESDETEPESGCFYAYFKTYEAACDFIERLNTWVDDKLAELAA